MNRFNRIIKITQDFEYKKLLHNYWNFGRNLWKPLDLQFDNNTTHSWFNINKSIPNNNNLLFNLNTHSISNVKAVRSVRLELFPTKKQKKTMISWMDAYIDMQNETIRFMKKCLFDKKKLVLNWRSLRDIHLTNKRDKIANLYKINIHCLDKAIKETCGYYKSALSNLGHASKFCVKYTHSIYFWKEC